MEVWRRIRIEILKRRRRFEKTTYQQKMIMIKANKALLKLSRNVKNIDFDNVFFPLKRKNKLKLEICKLVLLPIIMNKVLLEHNHVHLCIVYHNFLL